MPWSKFTDQLHENDKLGAVSDAAFRLWVLGITWSNAKLTDGHVPAARVPRLMVLRDARKTALDLVGAKLWHLASHPCESCLRLRKQKGVTATIPSGGYLIHDYHEYQPAAWKVLADRERMRALGRAGGVKSGVVRAKGDGLEDDDEAPRSSAALPSGDAETKRHGEAQRSSATVKRAGEAPRSSGPLVGDEAPRFTPVPPYPRTESDSSPVPRARVDDEPEIPAGTAAKAAGATGALRHVGGTAKAYETDPAGAARKAAR